MGKERQSAIAPRDKFLLLPVILAISLTVVTLIIPDLAPHFRYADFIAFRYDYDLRSSDVTFLFLSLALLVILLINFARMARRSYTLMLGRFKTHPMLA